MVESLRDSRIIYVNPGKRLSMSENWEFALSSVTGDYVTYLGDDDGFINGAIGDLAELIQRTGTPAISWRWASYFWPDCIDENTRNLLLIPLETRIEQRSAGECLKKALEFKLPYHELPFLYKGLISTEVVRSIQGRSGGRFFHSCTPDLYSAVVIAASVQTYHYSKFPFSINGVSSHSNGAAQFHSGDPSGAAAAFNSEGNLPFHPKLVLAPSHPILLAECFMQAMDHVAGFDAPPVDLRMMLAAARRELERAPEARIEKVREAAMGIGRRNGLEEETRKIFTGLEGVRVRHDIKVGMLPGVNLYRKQIIIDGAAVGITNIQSAAVLTRLVLQRRKAHLAWSYPAAIRTTLLMLRGLIRRKFSH